MHYFGENMHKTKVFFCIKVKNMLNDESLLFSVLCQNVYPFNQKYIRKGRRESPIFAM